MFNLIRKFALFFSIVLIGYFSYDAFWHNTAKPWKNFTKPQLASYTSLEQDEAILKELKRQTQYSTYKPLDPIYFVKPNIFKSVERK